MKLLDKILHLVIWLLSLSVLTGAETKVDISPLPVPSQGKTGYQLLSPDQTGLVPQGKYVPPKNIPIRETGHSGLAAGDVNGDGWVDLYVCGMKSANALYINKGNWKFEDRAQLAGVACRGWRLSGAVFADVDGDGDLDLVVTSLLDGRNFMFLNDGKGNFKENRKVGWIYNPRGGTVSASFADVDGDGDLDMYTTGFVKIFLNQELDMNYAMEIQKLGLKAIEENRVPPEIFWEYYDIDEKDHIEGLFKGEDAIPQMRPAYIEDQLYLNNGKGSFVAVSDRERRFVDYQGRTMKRPRDPSHEALFRDVDGDGDPDLYVTSDFAPPDRLWLNDGRGYFRQAHPHAMRRTSQFSMGMDFTDLNRDGHLDFLTADMLSRSHKRRKTQMGDMQVTESGIGLVNNRPQIMQNTLQLGRGDGTWVEIAQLAGVKATEWSWGVAFTDVDLDGYEDLIVATGMTRDFMDADSQKRVTDAGRDTNKLEDLLLTREWFPKLPTQNIAYRNNGDLTFKYKSDDWGFSTEAVSGGLAEADFDGDGDLDIIFNNWTSPLEVYRNDTIAPRVAVKLKGLGNNSGAIGAKVRLLGGPGGLVPMEHEIVCGGGYASGSDTLVVFGTGEKTENLKLEIIWRRKERLHRTLIDNVKPNSLYSVEEPSVNDPYQIQIVEPRPPLFVAVDHFLTIPHPDEPGVKARIKHNETVFDDFAYQSLLPNRFSQMGPGVAWADLNQDGWDDLIIGSGKGGELMIHLSRGDGSGFTGQRGFRNRLDQSGLLVMAPKAGSVEPIIMVGQSNYEQPGKAFQEPASVLGFSSGQSLNQSRLLAGSLATTGPLAAADVDGDGDLDLFVGGRTVPARYPEPADSRLFLNEDGKFKLDAQNSKVFEMFGLVSGAVFGDLDKDGDADLIAALEWGPVKVMRNDGGKFKDVTEEMGLSNHKGWWNSVALGDFNGDGLFDIVAGNWGRNSKYEYSYSFNEPLRMTYSDFDKNGVLDIVEYHRDKLTGKMVPERGRSCSTRAMPFIGERNESFNVFGERTLKEVYGECLKEGKVLEANVLEHTLFLNRGGKFEARALPIEAQFSPVFGLNIADFNNDGKEDVFVAQNFFASQRETPRSDGGRGLLMLGDGEGGLETISGIESGIEVYGEQRGSAVSDFNQDGRPDIIITQNGALARLYQNKEARPGLRIKLNAGPANPTGVGAAVRLVWEGGKLGPARLIAAGSGYWSQDSAVQVLGSPKEIKPTHLEVYWSGGKTTRTEIPKDSKEIQIGSDGKLISSK